MTTSVQITWNWGIAYDWFFSQRILRHQAPEAISFADFPHRFQLQAPTVMRLVGLVNLTLRNKTKNNMPPGWMPSILATRACVDS